MAYNYIKTQEDLTALEARLTATYAQATGDIEEELNKFFAKFKKQDKALRKKLEAGEITEEYYRQWRQNQMFEVERYEQLKSNLAVRMLNVDKVAAAMVNNQLPAVYAMNSTFDTYKTGVSMGTSFSVVNDDAIYNVVKGENHSEFRVLSVDPVRDYNWNYERIQSALATGIAKGDSIDDMTGRFYDVMGSNRYAAYRNARTAYMSAQNAGIDNSTSRIELYGYETEEIWVATLDARTRTSHRALHGVKVKHGELFPNGLRYPGDPLGHPSEVYNCRCTKVRHIVGVNDSILKSFPTSEEAMEILYSRNPKVTRTFKTEEERRAFYSEFCNNDVDSYREWLKNNANKSLYNELKDKGMI